MSQYGTPFERAFTDTPRYMPEPNSGCWLWTGKLNEKGYGQIRRWVAGGGVVYEMAHRISYEGFVGPIPDELEIDHKCRTKCCVNPFHLEPVTRLENQHRAMPYRKVKAKERDFCERGHELACGNRINYLDGSRGCRICLILEKKEKIVVDDAARIRMEREAAYDRGYDAGYKRALREAASLMLTDRMYIEGRTIRRSALIMGLLKGESPHAREKVDLRSTLPLDPTDPMLD